MQARSSAHEPTLAEAWDAAASVLYGHSKYRLKRLFSLPARAATDCKSALRGLHRDGYWVLPSFYDTAMCTQAREEIDQLIKAQPEAVQSFGQGSDCRVYGSENASAIARRFHDDAFCLNSGRAYSRAPLANFSTLAARLIATPGNLGSGQGWHRDAFHFQYKAMVYLSDVGMENGPFQILPRSHRGFRAVQDTVLGRLDRPPASRISEQQMERLLTKNPARAKPLPGPAGTLILFNSSTIHRGMPIHSGSRYALTNYYYPLQSITPEMYRHFAPLARS